MISIPRERGARTGIWTAAVFYLLIAFEFFYMATPFALYFYGAYRPTLRWLGHVPATAWLTSFFLPHYATFTSSAFINAHNAVGAAIMGIGVVAFAVSAGQVYFAKLARAGAVTGGMYRFIRHPQYTALAVSGLGLLLLWPRFLALLFFVIMLFAYNWLARVEEQECARNYGEPYRDYQRRTAGFLPFRIPLLSPCVDRVRDWTAPRSTPVRVFLGLGLLATAMSLAVGFAFGLRSLTVDSQHAVYSGDAAFVAICDLDIADLNRIVQISARDPQVAARLLQARTEGARGFINYVLPSEWNVPEIPMNAPPEPGGDHFTPRTYNRRLIKVIVTRAEFFGESTPHGREILLRAISRTPVLEARVDLASGEVTRVVGPPRRVRYENVPVPVL